MMNKFLLAFLLLLASSVPAVSAFVTPSCASNRVLQPPVKVQRNLPKESTRVTSPEDARTSSTALSYAVSPEPIHTAFNVANFGPQVRRRENNCRWMCVMLDGGINISKNTRLYPFRILV